MRSACRQGLKWGRQGSSGVAGRAYVGCQAQAYIHLAKESTLIVASNALVVIVLVQRDPSMNDEVDAVCQVALAKDQGAYMAEAESNCETEKESRQEVTLRTILAGLRVKNCPLGRLGREG